MVRDDGGLEEKVVPGCVQTVQKNPPSTHLTGDRYS